MQSSLMRDGTGWLLISPIQMRPWTWLNIWLIQLPHLPRQIFMFTKINRAHCFIPPPAISPDSSFTFPAKIASRRETWVHELETHQHYQVWKRLLGTKTSQITCASTVFPTHLGLIQLLVTYTCQDCSRFSLGYHRGWSAVKAVQGWMGLEVRNQILSNMSSPLHGSGAPNLVWLYQGDLLCGTAEPDNLVENMKRKQQVVEWMKLRNRWRKEGVMGHFSHEVITDKAVPTAGCFSSALQIWFIAACQQTFLNHETRP